MKWLPISQADKDIAYIHDMAGLRIGGSHPIWVRDEDGRVYEALWSDDGKRAYWWDIEGESPVDPVEFMPHPLDPRCADATEAKGQPMSKAIDDVLAERRRQIEAEGWSSKHDDVHASGEIAGAAACYAMHDLSFTIPNIKLGHAVAMLVKDLWPWAASWWKPTDRRRNLVKAAALLIAEIDRIDRADASKPTGGGDADQ